MSNSRVTGRLDYEIVSTHTRLIMQLLTVNLTGKVQQKTLNGREYLVAPVSMIVPGVLPGSRGPLLYTLNEIKRSEFSWNGVPLVLEHPKDDAGNLVSARSPDVLEKYQLGFVFNAGTRNNRLEGEAWFDKQKTQQLSSGILANLQNGESLELSTGLLTDNVARKPGVVNGRTYTQEATNFRPDHLAVLLSGPGACSIQDGCGVLVNESGEEFTDNNCGIGSGGFQPGNTCGKGGGGSSKGGSKTKLPKKRSKVSIQQAGTALAEKGMKLGRSKTDLKTKMTSYEVEMKDGSKKMMTTDEIKDLVYNQADIDDLSQLVANYNAADTTETFSQWLVSNECKCGGRKSKAVHNEEADEETTARKNTERLGILGNEFGFQPTAKTNPSWSFQPS